jgi:hypothetical protein
MVTTKVLARSGVAPKTGRSAHNLRYRLEPKAVAGVASTFVADLFIRVWLFFSVICKLHHAGSQRSPVKALRKDRYAALP